ncbi:MAG TPA: YoaK family protein [Acidobacteriaceae bacterium]|nr:YoaK family protein [Acidobacteriaceae bacterium]
MPSLGDSPSTSATERRATQSLSSALLLTFTGGFLDAFLYVTHGGVFAGAMTGNLVLFGIALLSRDSHQALHHLLPIVAFALGIWCAFVAEAGLRHHVVLVALALESAGLFIASLLPHTFPGRLFIALICILAGYQVGSFRTVDTFVYNATFIAGNILRTVESFHAILIRIRHGKPMREFRDLGLVLVLFLVGAVTAATLAGRMGNHALCVPLVAVLAVLSITLWRELKQPRPPRRKIGEPI